MPVGYFVCKEKDRKKNVRARKIHDQSRNTQVYSNGLNVLKTYIKVRAKLLINENTKRPLI